MVLDTVFNTANCSQDSFAAVKLSQEEEAILTNAGFTIENSTYNRDPEEISQKAVALLNEVNNKSTDMLGKISYYTGLIGDIYSKNELAKDLKIVANDVHQRGKDGSNAQAPSAAPEGKLEKIGNVAIRALSCLSHEAASYAGKKYRTV